MKQPATTEGADTHGFLGEEFLTWIWFRWETSGGEFTLSGGRVVGVALDDFLSFAAPSDDETEQTLRHGLPTRTQEARTALRQGRRLRKARMLVAEGPRQWSATFDAPTMTLNGVKLPEDAEECESEQDRTADRTANWLACTISCSAVCDVPQGPPEARLPEDGRCAAGAVDGDLTR